MGALALVLAVASFVTAAATTAYQVIQAKKMKKQAKAASDARKGFELVAEGEPGYLPIVYGRALVGGYRSWHGVSSSFKYVTPNSNKSFLTGSPGGNAYSYTTNVFMDDFTRTVPIVTNVSAQAAGYMSASLTGSRNEFLYFQQAMCMGPINAIRDVIIDGGRYINDPTLGSYGKIAATSNEKEKSGVKAALRLDYHFHGGADNITVANFAERKTATFDKIAYLAAAFRLDRDEPQFQNVPGVQALVEGRRVRWITDGVISTTKSFEEDPTKYAYTTSGPLCLLDYMLDQESGGKYDLEDIDLDSFEHAHTISTSIVQPNVKVGGKFWKSTDGIYNISTRNLPLYECNIVIDTSKPVRENIEAILSTMGDARLVWSGGKYRLNMQYPLTNDDIVVAGEINDDNLVLEADIDIAWPNAQDRYNHAIVRFHNEYENFKEDSVNWPPKYNTTTSIGVGAKSYSNGLGSWDDSKAGGRLLNQYNVWVGTGDNAPMTWKLRVTPEQRGTYNLSVTADDAYTFTIKQGSTTLITRSKTGKYNANHVGTGTVTLGDASGPVIYDIALTAINNGSGSKDYKGGAAKLENAGTVLWTTRSVSYDAYSTVSTDNTVYNQLLTEDNGLELEADVFADGITDPHHALAKAEELVRTSRSSTGYTFTHVITDRLYDPGDFLRFRSEQLNIGVVSPLYLRVEEVNVIDEDKCELVTSRFDYSQLAWAVKDDVYINAPTVYSSFIPQPYEIIYTPPSQKLIQTSGTLTTTPVGVADFAGFVWFAWRAGIDPVDEYGQPILSEIGRSTEPTFELPALYAASAFFGVKTLTTSGGMSRMTTTDVTKAVELEHTWTKSVILEPSAIMFKRVANVLTPAIISIKAATVGFNAPIYEWYIDGVLQADVTGDTLILDAFMNVSEKAISIEVTDAEDNNIYLADLVIPYVEEGTYGAPSGTPVGDMTADEVVTKINDTLEQVDDLFEIYGDTASAANSAAIAQAAADHADGVKTTIDGLLVDADAAKVAAEDAASEAVTKAQEAGGYATVASTKADEAAGSATSSAASAVIAGNNATAAATSASTATTKATEASNSASAANTSATNAGESANTATTKATEASNSASSAAGSASAASISASAAANSANDADGSATAASNSASTAGSAATDAGLSASAANNSALTANTKANEAEGYANAASSSAGTAVASATDAGNSASAANTAKLNAETAANNASISANSAVTAKDGAELAASAATSSAITASIAAAAKGLTKNADFSEGVAGWYGLYYQDIPPQRGVWQATYQGEPGVWTNNSDQSSYLYSGLFPINPARKYKIRGRVYSPGGNSIIYIGTQSVDGTSTPIGGNSGHNYITGWGGTQKPAGWHTIESPVLTGEGSSVEVGDWFRLGTTQARIVAYLNYNEVSYVWGLSSFWIEDVTESEAAANSAAISATSASLASASESVAKTNATMSAVYASVTMPNNFEQEGRFWSYLTGSEITAVSPEGAGYPITYPVTEDGRVLRVNNGAGYTHVSQRRRINLASVKGRRFSIRAKARVITPPATGTVDLVVGAYGLTTDYATLVYGGYLEDQSGVYQVPMPTAGIYETQLDFTIAENIIPDGNGRTAVWSSWGAYLFNATAPNETGVVDFISIDIEDVTESVSAKTSANIATNQQVLATNAAAAAQQSAVLSSSLSGANLLKNGSFADWPITSSSGIPPAGWTYAGQIDGSNGSSMRREAVGVSEPSNSPWKMQVICGANSTMYYRVQKLPVTALGYYVLSATAQLGSGPYFGDGVIAFFYDAGGVYLGRDQIDFHTTVSSNGYPTSTDPRPYDPKTWTKLIRAPATATQVAIYVGTYDNVFGVDQSNRFYKWYNLYHVGLTPATQEEIAAGITLPALQATVATQATTLATHDTRLASWVTRASAGTGYAEVTIAALDANNVAASRIGLIADSISLGNAVDGVVAEVVKIENGKAKLNSALIRDLRVAPTVSSDVFFPVQLAPLSFLVEDGDTVYYEDDGAGGKSLGMVPEIDITMPVVALASGESLDVRATNITDKKFDLVAKKVTAGGPVVVTNSETVNDAGSGNTPRYRMNKATLEDAYDGKYQFAGSVYLPRTQIINEGPGFNWVTYEGSVDLYATNASNSNAWTLIKTIGLSKSSYYTGPSPDKLAVSFSDVITLGFPIGQHGGYEFGVHPTNGATFNYFSMVKWSTRVSSGTATPITGTILCRVYPQLV